MQAVTERINLNPATVDTQIGLLEQQFAAQTWQPTEQVSANSFDPYSMDAYMNAFMDVQLNVTHLSADEGPLTDEGKDALLGMQLAVVGLGEGALSGTVAPEIEFAIDPGFIAMNEGLLRDSLKRIKSYTKENENDENDDEEA